MAELRRVALLTGEHPALGHIGGVGSYTATLANALAATGVEVRCFVADEHGGVSEVGDGAAKRIGTWHGPILLRALSAAAILSSRLRQYAPDIIEAPNWGGLGAAIRIPDGCPLVIRLSTPVLGIRPRDPLRAATALGHHAWEARSVRRADRVIADSSAVADLAHRLYGRRSDAVIPHPLAATPAPPAPPSGTGVLAVGRLEHRKGTDVLLEAWAAIRTHHPNWSLHLVGADTGGFGAAAVARYGTTGVSLHGRLGAYALAQLAAQCPIAVVPSRWESFGMVVLEAWNRGQTVVSSDAGGLPEVIGEAGVIVPRNRADALATGLSRLLGDAALRIDLARRGRDRLQTRFSPAICAAATLAVYQAAAQNCGT